LNNPYQTITKDKKIKNIFLGFIFFLFFKLFLFSGFIRHFFIILGRIKK